MGVRILVEAIDVREAHHEVERVEDRSPAQHRRQVDVPDVSRRGLRDVQARLEPGEEERGRAIGIKFELFFSNSPIHEIVAMFFSIRD